MKYIFLLITISFTGCLSTVPLVPTKVSRSEDGTITRQEYIPVIDDANRHISSAVKKVPIHVKLYHMPSARPNRLAMRENWSQPPHIYEYDMAEQKYEREIQGGSFELPGSHEYYRLYSLKYKQTLRFSKRSIHRSFHKVLGLK